MVPLALVLALVVPALAPLLAEGEAVLLRPPERGALLALERLRASSGVPVTVRWSPATGRVLSLEGRFALEPSAELADRCLALLSREPLLFGLDPAHELRLVSRRRGLGTEHLRFEAWTAGLRIARSTVAFHIDVSDPARPVLVYLESRLEPGTRLPGPGGAPPPGGAPAPRLGAAEAARIAEAAVAARAELRAPSVARLEVDPVPAPGRLAYAVRVSSLAPRGLFLVRVDASSGEVLSVGDLLRYAPPGTADGKGRAFLVSPMVALRDASLRDRDDAADAVPLAAYADVVLRDLDGGGMLAGPYVTTERTYRAARRVRLDFSSLRDADHFEEVMAYYHIDRAQRSIQSLGFTEVYNRPIPVYANSEPPGVPYTEDQAYYQPSFDEPGTGEIALGSGGVDDGEDPEVIVHEYGHACQDNQVPGFGQDFESFETFAIGEGWSDWLAAAYLSAWSGGEGDLCLGEWDAAGRDEPFPGEGPRGCVRRLDSTKRYPDALVGEPHEDGEMWSASLWRIFEALGREDSLKLVFQSNFYLGVNATFEDAANAVLRADRELFSGAHEDAIRGVFADRGFFLPPLSLSWFHVRKHAPATPLPEDGALVSKLLLTRPGSVPPGSAGLEVYVSLAHPAPGEVEMSLRSPSGTAVRLNAAGSRFLPGGRPLVFGATLEPLEPLDRLGGEPIAGIWALELRNGFFDQGSLSEWGLRFQGFLRGDADGDGKLGVSDAIGVLEFLFRRGRLSCLKAADADDSGTLEITDAIRLLLHLFAGGPAPPEPYPEAGEDLTPDGLTCGD